MIKRWQYVMIHHSLTKDGQTVSWQAIRRYHTQDLGWRDIGYHYGLEDINGQYEVLVGRDLNTTGAHCKEAEMNEKAIGVCLVGNFDEELPSIGIIDRALRFVSGLTLILDVPIRNVIAHRDFATYKSCPGTRFNMEKFRSDLKIMIGGGP
jgi:N-acetylmuramoyl-L-alanine amidase